MLGPVTLSVHRFSLGVADLHLQMPRVPIRPRISHQLFMGIELCLQTHGRLASCHQLHY